jgi:hypothetical protein
MKSRPFARYEDDENMNDMFKAQDRWGDPMLALLVQKKFLFFFNFFLIFLQIKIANGRRKIREKKQKREKK